MLHDAGEESDVAVLRKAVLDLLVARKEVTLHAQALRELHESYQATGATTNFEAELSGNMDEQAAAES